MTNTLYLFFLQTLKKFTQNFVTHDSSQFILKKKIQNLFFKISQDLFLYSHVDHIYSLLYGSERKSRMTLMGAGVTSARSKEKGCMFKILELDHLVCLLQTLICLLKISAICKI